MSLSLRCHLGTIIWNPFDHCSQTIPQPHSLVIYGCSPHMKDTLSPPLSIFSCPPIPTVLSAPSPLIQPHSLHPPSPSQPVPQTDFPTCFDFSQRSPFTSHLNWEWDLPRRHCCLCGLLELRLFILRRYKSSGQHSPRSSWPPPSHYASTLLLKCVSFVSHAIWLYH